MPEKPPLLTKNQLKLIRSLRDRKHRDAQNLFVAEGEKIVAEALASGWPVELVVCSDAWASAHPSAGRMAVAAAHQISAATGLSTAPEVLAVMRAPAHDPSVENFGTGIILALDTIRDPGNLGTIIRIADWFGIGRVVCSEDCADLYNAKTIQSTMGSFLRVKVFYLDLALFLQRRRKSGLPVFGAAKDGSDIRTVPKPKDCTIVIGNESRGISPALKPHIMEFIAIPRYGNSSIDSLNAAVSAGIVCAEFRKP